MGGGVLILRDKAFFDDTNDVLHFGAGLGAEILFARLCVYGRWSGHDGAKNMIFAGGR